MSINNEDIIELIKPILGNDVTLSGSIESNNNSIFIAKAADNEYIVKFYKYRGWPEIDKIPYVNKLLQNNNIQCASMKAYEREDNRFENGYIIEERVKGVPILSKDGIPFMPKDKFTSEFETYIYTLLAKLIVRVHNITFSKYGYINGGHPSYNTFHKFMEETIMLNNIDGLIDNQVFTKSNITELVHRLCENFKEFDDLKPVLCHGDLSLRNVIYNRDKLTLIDWDDSMALPWMTDIAYLTYPFVCSKVKQMYNRNVILEIYATEYEKNRFYKFEKLYHAYLSLKYLDWRYKHNQGKGANRIKHNLNELLNDIGINFQVSK